MAVRTKCLYAPPEPSDGDRILVSRYWPPYKTWAKLQLTQFFPQLAPSPALLKAYRANRLMWGEFDAAYRAEMEAPLGKVMIKRLAEWARSAHAEGKNITLLCFEKEDTHCHRRILKELIQREIERQDAAPCLLDPKRTEG